jgi:hypothetical protein
MWPCASKLAKVCRPRGARRCRRLRRGVEHGLPGLAVDGRDVGQRRQVERLCRINTRPFQKLDGCRRSAFEAIDCVLRAIVIARYAAS